MVTIMTLVAMVTLVSMITTRTMVAIFSSQKSVTKLVYGSQTYLSLQPFRSDRPCPCERCHRQFALIRFLQSFR